MVLISMTVPVFAQNYSGSPDYSYNSYKSSSTQAPQQNYPTTQTQSYQTQPQAYQTSQNQYPQNNYQSQQSQPAQNYNQIPPAPNNYNKVPAQNNYNLPPLQGHVVTVPPGTMLPAVTTNRTLSSQNLRTGDRISVFMNAPFYYNGTMVLPAGTRIIGTVVMAEAAGRAGKNGKLMILFNRATTPTGQNIGLSGKLATDDGTGVLKGGTGMSRATKVVKDTAVGAGLGALFGLIGSAISGGSKGKGAALGSAIGGGLGATKTVIDKGNNVIIKAGEELNIILNSELRIGGETNVPSLPPLNQNYDNNYGH